ncbi:hypothetical protein J6590_045666 [Homalodisca vitripennis]|nr:hypothetical protein J6590_045666 [Homalodisca vitripennis]
MKLRERRLIKVPRDRKGWEIETASCRDAGGAAGKSQAQQQKSFAGTTACPPTAAQLTVPPLRCVLEHCFIERHITNHKCRDSGVQGQFDRSSLLREMTIGVGGVCSLTSDVLASLNKGVPPSAYFDWRGCMRAGFPFFRGDMTLRLVP